MSNDKEKKDVDDIDDDVIRIINKKLHKFIPMIYEAK